MLYVHFNSILESLISFLISFLTHILFSSELSVSLGLLAFFVDDIPF